MAHSVSTFSPRFADARFNGRAYVLPDGFDICKDNFNLPETIDNFVLSAERLMKVGQGTFRGTAVTGERYVEFASSLRINRLDEKEADRRLIRWMWCVLADYWKEERKKGVPVLYWRMKPELVTFDGNENFDFPKKITEKDLLRRIYMRYLISSAPIKEEFLEPA